VVEALAGFYVCGGTKLEQAFLVTALGFNSHVFLLWLCAPAEYPSCGLRNARHACNHDCPLPIPIVVHSHALFGPSLAGRTHPRRPLLTCFFLPIHGDHEPAVVTGESCTLRARVREFPDGVTGSNSIVCGNPFPWPIDF